MELKKLKTRHNAARRGHKLLKDKLDGMMKQFLEIVREAKELRRSLEARFTAYNGALAAASAETDKLMLTEALMLPRASGTLRIGERNIMSVVVPEFGYTSDAPAGAAGANYGYAFTTGALDDAVAALSDMTADLVRLAQLEKTAMLLCEEIERTRRRVNALEYIMIPRLETAIKTIRMKLDENERGNITRLMKVKDMMIEKALAEKRAE